MPESTPSLPDWLSRGMADLFPAGDPTDADQALAARLAQAEKEGRPLRVKLGIDPTGSNIHLGHSILFRKLRAFQDAGHTAVLIIGDFTARIGDPTGKSATRVQLSKEDVAANASTYLRQLGQDQPKETALLDFETPGRLEVRYNSEWLEGMDLPAVIGLLGTGTVGQMLAKDDFSKRYGSGTPIALHEFLYPLLQGYDSVAVNADVELGGTDQKFNVAMGRDLQRHFNKGTQFGLLLPILVGLDGVQKMSKSLGNVVGLEEDPLSMYSKLEKVGDGAINDYVTLQKAMALAVTASRHGMEAAQKAQLDAASLVGGAGDAATEVPGASLAEVNFPAKAFYLLSAVGICASSSEARRQIKGGAVRLEGEKIGDPNQEFASAAELEGKVLQLGKKTFRRLTA
jgi:tyrosyl-tRNA synthetase